MSKCPRLFSLCDSHGAFSEREEGSSEIVIRDSNLFVLDACRTEEFRLFREIKILAIFSPSSAKFP